MVSLTRYDRISRITPGDPIFRSRRPPIHGIPFKDDQVRLGGPSIEFEKESGVRQRWEDAFI